MLASGDGSSGNVGCGEKAEQCEDSERVTVGFVSAGARSSRQVSPVTRVRVVYSGVSEALETG